MVKDVLAEIRAIVKSTMKFEDVKVEEYIKNMTD